MIAPRFPLEFELSVNGGAHRSGSARSFNVSQSGLGMEGEALLGWLRVGEQVRLSLKVNEDLMEPAFGPKVWRQIEMDARVVWSDEGRCGVIIERMPTGDREFYDSVITGYETLCRAFADLQAVS